MSMATVQPTYGSTSTVDGYESDAVSRQLLKSRHLLATCLFVGLRCRWPMQRGMLPSPDDARHLSSWLLIAGALSLCHRQSGTRYQDCGSYTLSLIHI